MSSLQKRIVEYLRVHHNADGIDLATVFHLPIDKAYREVQALIDAGVIRKEYVGLNTRLVVVNARPGAQRTADPADAMREFGEAAKRVVDEIIEDRRR